MQKTIQKTFKLITLASLQTFVLTGISQISHAASPSDFDLCIRELTRTGLSSNQAGQACAQAFRPKELAYCVQRINFHTEINPETLLSNCFRVRRPAELADCVVDIRLKADNNVDPNQIMGYCRRSLLPQRFANCVLSVNSQGNTALSDSLDICIRAKSQ
jgi:hypothetical protein